MVTPRNRAAFTVQAVDGFKAVLARGSIKPPSDVSDRNAYLLGLFLDRDATTEIAREDLISLRAQWRLNADLVSVSRKVKVNLEPDWKRQLVRPEMTNLGGDSKGRAHLSTRSRPFEFIEEMIDTRLLFEQWRHSQGRCLKTLEDWHDWEAYHAMILAARAAGRRPYGSSNPVAHLKRQFLRAMVRGECGLGLHGRSYAQVAAWLTAAGYPTSHASVKNAARGGTRGPGARPERGDAPLVEHR